VDSTVDDVDVNPGDGVCSTAGGAATLRAAIMEANALDGPDTIVLSGATTYTLALGPADSGLGEIVDYAGDLDITESVDLIGNGAVVSANGIDRVFDLDGTTTSSPFLVRMRDLTVTGGVTQGNPLAFGGGIHIRGGGLLLIDSTISGNQAGANGGGLSAESVIYPDQWPTSVTLRRCAVFGNSGENGGGVFGSSAHVILEDTSVKNNLSLGGFGGGGVLVTGWRSVLDCSGGDVSANTSGNRGGGTLIACGGASFLNAEIAGNEAGGDGGGVFVGPFLPAPALGIRETHVTENQAGASDGPGVHGGALANTNGAVEIEFSRIVDNADRLGVAVYSPGGTVDAARNWWGCNAGPSGGICGTVSGAVTVSPWMVLRLLAASGEVLKNNELLLTADLTLDSNGDPTGPSQGVVPPGIPAQFGAITGGTIASADPALEDGRAQAIFLAGNTTGTGNASLEVDHQYLTVAFEIIPYPDLWMIR